MVKEYVKLINQYRIEYRQKKLSTVFFLIDGPDIKKSYVLDYPLIVEWVFS